MDHYHVGIVVTDIDAASAKLSELVGVTWGPIMHLEAVEYRDEKGDDVVLPTTMRYSTGTPCLELILEVPGSVWVRNEDQRPEAYKEMETLYRPSHADYTYQAKYGIRNWQGGGRASARETT